ncbi:MAG: aldehyde dehydrogenase family protein, partial [Spirosomaceae bacterium]|nr:aldehyde dehydrogenase family protein [Spirosomataceae bacterium]
MKFQTINPYNNEVLAEYTEQTQTEITATIDKAQAGFETWREWSFKQRADVMRKAAQILKKNVETYAKTISLEMGKPITEARGEVNKCTLVLEYYA